MKLNWYGTMGSRLVKVNGMRMETSEVMLLVGS